MSSFLYVRKPWKVRKFDSTILRKRSLNQVNIGPKHTALPNENGEGAGSIVARGSIVAPQKKADGQEVVML